LLTEIDARQRPTPIRLLQSTAFVATRCRAVAGDPARPAVRHGRGRRPSRHAHIAATLDGVRRRVVHRGRPGLDADALHAADLGHRGAAGLAGQVVSIFAASLFVGSSLAAVFASNLADQGRYGSLFATSAVLAVPLGMAATAVRARCHSPAATSSGL
jgi:hypothetical protein